VKPYDRIKLNASKGEAHGRKHSLRSNGTGEKEREVCQKEEESNVKPTVERECPYEL
jgi:hypothetical protein